jgi:hypothetical protein
MLLKAFKRKKQKVICVLGMHRSGTSALAGSLEEAGVYLGDVVQYNPYNVKGTKENSRIMELHDDLLAANGGSWFSPPENVRWSRSHKKKAKAIIYEYQNQILWGFKDPRTIFAVEGWLKLIPDIHWVGIYRNPLSVAESLKNRDNLPFDQGVALWIRYNERLLKHHDTLKFPIVSFDLSEEMFRIKLIEVYKRLGVNQVPSDITFFEPQLRHSQIMVEGYPIQLRAKEIYTALQLRSV